MKHSRPGFATRTSDVAPAKLNDDMVPAINRAARTASTPLKTNGPSLEAMLEAHGLSLYDLEEWVKEVTG